MRRNVSIANSNDAKFQVHPTYSFADLVMSRVATDENIDLACRRTYYNRTTTTTAKRERSDKKRAHRIEPPRSPQANIAFSPRLGAGVLLFTYCFTRRFQEIKLERGNIFQALKLKTSPLSGLLQEDANGLLRVSYIKYAHPHRTWSWTPYRTSQGMPAELIDLLARGRRGNVYRTSALSPSLTPGAPTSLLDLQLTYI
ncbi:hypothetical protein EVAR_29247_1 [Eumeta japonica]|uniref:Uncharacterized protein n=1 Tax=Eumeta variegata TaxID=151549 RepID=A0A4C1VI22_EUMVA|nr:hypothetical protein EVAR_29247_1 [Eumeta japonica]